MTERRPIDGGKEALNDKEPSLWKSRLEVSGKRGRGEGGWEAGLKGILFLKKNSFYCVKLCNLQLA